MDSSSDAGQTQDLSHLKVAEAVPIEVRSGDAHTLAPTSHTAQFVYYFSLPGSCMLAPTRNT